MLLFPSKFSKIYLCVTNAHKTNFRGVNTMNKKRFVSILTLVFVLLSMVTVAFATGEAAPADAAATGEPLPWYAGLLSSPIPMLVIMFALFYFVLIRPENKRKKETANMRNNLKAGDKITTIGGIIGRVIKVKDDELVIETSTDHSKLRLAKWAVSSVEKKADEKTTAKLEVAAEETETTDEE